jgi:hypothetical protein
MADRATGATATIGVDVVTTGAEAGTATLGIGGILANDSSKVEAETATLAAADTLVAVVVTALVVLIDETLVGATLEVLVVAVTVTVGGGGTRLSSNNSSFHRIVACGSGNRSVRAGTSCPAFLP